MHLFRTNGPATPGALLFLGTLVIGTALAAAAAAEPLPVPTVEFALKANVSRGGTLELAHGQSKMRIEMNNPRMPAPLFGLIDLKARKMVMMIPNVRNLAVEVDIPPQYAVGAIAGEGTKVGEAQIIGETCTVWKVTPSSESTGTTSTGTTSTGTTYACLTSDGIALRTEAEVNGVKMVLYEATQLTRAPQDPKLFELPKDIQLIKMPEGKAGMMGLPQPGGLAPGAAAPGAPAAAAPAPAAPAPAAPAPPAASAPAAPAPAAPAAQ